MFSAEPPSSGISPADRVIPIAGTSPSLRERCVGNHPVAGFFHIAFKVLAILLYEFGSWFSLGYVAVFVACTILLAIDFWVVKNVIGRVMVRLRWWNDIQADGRSEWRFESGVTTPSSSSSVEPQPSEIHPLDARFFWAVLIGQVVLWVVMLIASVLGTWKYIPLTLVALALAVTNASGYLKCRKDARKLVGEWASQRAAGVVQRNPHFVSQLASSLFKQAVGTGDSSTQPVGGAIPTWAAAAAAAPAAAPATSSSSATSSQLPRPSGFAASAPPAPQSQFLPPPPFAPKEPASAAAAAAAAPVVFSMKPQPNCPENTV